MDVTIKPKLHFFSLAVLSLALLTSACSPNDSNTNKSDTTESKGDTSTAVQTAAVGPWDLPPPPPNYNGPLFSLNHDYPTQAAPPKTPPWQAAINFGKINVDNAAAYTQALKDYIAEDMQTLIYDYANWPSENGWYNQPWLSQIRDPIRGTYIGSSFPPAMFPVSKLSANMTTHVAVYYDSVAAVSMEKVWGSSGTNPIPGLDAGSAQFPEGGIIIKPAYTTATPAEWAPMDGAYSVQIYANNDGSSAKKMMNVQLFQFDIIVKDSQSSPDSQWVFATLVYDKNAPGDSNWEKMIPLGAMWGNDPTVMSPQFCDYLTADGCPALTETWINPVAPVYAKETLGWGGRLSGPNDGAVDIDAVVLAEDGSLSQVAPKRYAMSSCMGCHGSAEYTMKSFLLPSPAACSGDSCTPTFATCNGDNCSISKPGPNAELVYYETGTDEFLNWFQDRPGFQPQDPGQIALDYGMNYAFKSLPSWYKNTGQSDQPLNFVEALNNYRGLNPAHDDQ